MQNDNDITLLINGKAHKYWQSYRIDSDFLTPSDSWTVTVGLPGGKFPDEINIGAKVEVKIGKDTVLVGRIDQRQRQISRRQCSLTLSGRDGAAVLVDCAAPICVVKQLSLEEIIATIVRPLGINNVSLKAASSITADKINVEPGERAWDTLKKAASTRGLWPWFQPDGTLVVGGIESDKPPVASLILRYDGKGNNLLSLNESTSIINRYSELTVLAQGHGRYNNMVIVDPDKDSPAVSSSNHNFKVVVKDTGITHHRPNIVVIGDCDSQQHAQYQAMKLLADGRLSGFSLIATVKGHRTSDGVLWQPGQRIHVISEPHNIDEVFFLIGREFSHGRSGSITELRLVEDGVWLPDAYPRDKRKSGNNKKLVVVDVD